MKRLFAKFGGKRGEANGGAGPEPPASSAGTPQPRQALAPQNSGPAISPTPLPYDPAAYGWLPAAEAAQLSPVGSRTLSPALSGAGSGMSRVRSARRPREALEFGVMLLPEPGAAKQQEILPPPPLAPEAPAEAEGAGLAAALAASEATAAEEVARGDEAAAEAEYQAAVDKAVEESLASGAQAAHASKGAASPPARCKGGGCHGWRLAPCLSSSHGSAHLGYPPVSLFRSFRPIIWTVDYDALLRDIRLWVMDLEGATGDVAAAREEAADARAKLDANMAAADPEDPDGWHRLCWLSEQVCGAAPPVRQCTSRHPRRQPAAEAEFLPLHVFHPCTTHGH